MARLDKYLWAIRCFKTRSEAADACNGGKVRMNGVPAKASKTVKPGDLLEIRKGPVLFTYKVVSELENRVGAALVEQYAINLTPDSEKEKMHAPVETMFLQRDRGSGRPTKKDRRTMDRLLETLNGSGD